MPNPVNPYIAGSPVTGKEMFFGRQDVFDFIQKALIGEHRDNVIVIYGQRRCGKTSVLYQMSRHLDEHYLCIFVDLHAFVLEGIGGFLWELANHIVRVLYRDHQIDLIKPDHAKFAANPRDYFESEFLNTVWSAIGNRHLLLAIDEAARLQEQVVNGQMEREIFEYLRHLMQHHERLDFLFSLGSRLDEMAQEYTFLFNVGLCQKISFLDKQATISLITEPVKDYYQVKSDAVKRIWHLTSGHAYYTQLLCHSLFNRWQQERTPRMEVKDVDELLDEVVERGLAVLKQSWDDSTASEKAMLSAMAVVAGKHNRPISANEIDRTWARFDVAIPKEEKGKALKSLIVRDIIVGVGRDKYKFAVDLQRLWIQKEQRLELVKAEIVDTALPWIAKTWLGKLKVRSRYRSKGILFAVLLTGFAAFAIQYICSKPVIINIFSRRITIEPFIIKPPKITVSDVPLTIGVVFGREHIISDECRVASETSRITQAALAKNKWLYFAMPFTRADVGKTLTWSVLSPTGNRLYGDEQRQLTTEKYKNDCFWQGFPLSREAMPGQYTLEIKLEGDVIYRNTFTVEKSDEFPPVVYRTDRKPLGNFTFGRERVLGFKPGEPCEVKVQTSVVTKTQLSESRWFYFASSYTKDEIGKVLYYTVYGPGGTKVRDRKPRTLEDEPELCFWQGFALNPNRPAGEYKLELEYESKIIYRTTFQLK